MHLMNAFEMNISFFLENYFYDLNYWSYKNYKILQNIFFLSYQEMLYAVKAGPKKGTCLQKISERCN